MNRVILLVLGLLMLTGCTEQLGATPLEGAPKTPPTYRQASQGLEKLKDSDAVAKEEKRKADENKLPADSTAFNLRPIVGSSALSKARKECKRLLGDYNKLATEYNAALRPRTDAPKDDPNLVIVRQWKTPNPLTENLPYTCGEDPR